MTTVGISGTAFTLNGSITHPGSTAEGCLLNSRMINAIFDDENAATVGNWAYGDTGLWDAQRNTDEFCAQLAAYASYGLRAVTVGLQGGWPGTITSGSNQTCNSSGFNSDGSLKSAWMTRLDQVIDACDAAGIVTIVSLFYFGQEQRLADETAILAACDNVADWLVAGDYTNILVEVINESNTVRYSQPVLQPDRVDELITRIKTRQPSLLVTANYATPTSSPAGRMPTADGVTASDFITLHGNGMTATEIRQLVDDVRAMSAYIADPKPIIFNEDGTDLANFTAATVDRSVSWGFYDQADYQSLPTNWLVNESSTTTAFFDAVNALTVEGPLTTTGLVVRYFFDEAASGTTPTQAMDVGPTPAFDLDLTYGSALSYAEVSGHRGLESTSDVGSHRAFKSIDNTSDKIRDAFQGVQKATIEIVIVLDAATNAVSRIFGISDRVSGTDGILMFEYDADATKTASTGGPGAFTISWGGVRVRNREKIEPVSRRVMHVVIDTTQADNANRVRFYTDGALDTTDMGAMLTTVVQNSTLSIPSGSGLVAMNRGHTTTWDRSFDGILFYAALYNVALNDAAIAQNATTLLADDDTPPGPSIVPISTITEGGWTAIG